MGKILGDNIYPLHGPIIALAITNVLYKKQAQIQEEDTSHRKISPTEKALFEMRKIFEEK